ncbi:MAG: 3'(2'),5'-bisphosphate nucleotidase CysQ [Bacteroidales bacterium]|nr:3'(2'),5'-bisphosphate nucleotidase CysQ [Bacteroidales bacterium]
MTETDSHFISGTIDLLREAAGAVMAVYDSGEFNTSTKDDLSPLTRADIVSNKIITEGLSLITPGIPVISEETKHLPFEERKKFAEVWILDPVDGTREFVSRNGEFCISLALIRGRRPVAGFILAPVTGELWFATEGGGSWLEKNGSRHRLPLKTPGKVKVITISRSHHNETEKEWIENFRASNKAEISVQGSAIKFCRLAEGNASVYPKFGSINEWDVAAGDIILREAGGIILETESGNEPLYNKESLKQPFFIAYGVDRKNPDKEPEA